MGTTITQLYRVQANLTSHANGFYITRIEEEREVQKSASFPSSFVGKSTKLAQQ